MWIWRDDDGTSWNGGEGWYLFWREVASLRFEDWGLKIWVLVISRLGLAMVADGSGKQRARPEWLQQYDLVGKIGEGTYGLVYLAKSKEPAHRWVYGCGHSVDLFENLNDIQ